MNGASMTVPARLAALAEERPDVPALVFRMRDGAREQRTWSELRRQADAVAARLARAWQDQVGRAPAVGDVLAIALGNRIEHLIAGHAAWRLGVTPVPINVRAPGPEQRAFLELADPRMVLAESAIAGWPTLTLDELRAAAEAPAEADPPASAPSDPAFGIGSGGSTGKPKLILGSGPLTLDLAALTEVYAAFGSQPGERTFIAGPLFHASGFFDSMTAMFLGQTVMMLERFDASAALALIEEERVASAVVVPTMLKRMLDAPELPATDFTHLRVLCHLGAPCPPTVKRAWIDTLGPERVHEIYGSTENAGMTTIRGDEWLRRVGSVGRPVRARLRILDAAGTEVPTGEIGEVFMSPIDGEVAFDYRGGDPPRVRDGFASVGDLGWVDADGFLYIADRRSDLIISGGSNVFPAEVESVLSAHPEVLDVAVIGLPDEEWGKTVHAIVVPRPGTAPSSDALRAFCRERLAPYKAPKTVELVERLPRNEVGKVRRRALAEERARSAGA